MCLGTMMYGTSTPEDEALKYRELGSHKYSLLGIPYSLSENAKLTDEEFKKQR